MAHKSSTRKAAEFFIIRTSYWQGDNGSIVAGGFTSRKAAETHMAKLENENTGDVKHDNKFQVVSRTQATRQFGSEWWNATSDDYESFATR